MATVLIENGAIAGAAAAIMAGRSPSGADSEDPAEWADVANAAAAFADQFITANSALDTPMADADNAQIFLVCYAASFGVLSGRRIVSATAADYAVPAAAAAAIAKQCEAKLVA